jgi:hypothetical protein
MHGQGSSGQTCHVVIVARSRLAARSAAVGRYFRTVLDVTIDRR